MIQEIREAVAKAVAGQSDELITAELAKQFLALIEVAEAAWRHHATGRSGGDHFARRETTGCSLCAALARLEGTK